MKRKAAFAGLLAISLLSACEQRRAEAPEADSVPGEWLEADGPGEMALVFPGQPGRVTITCAQESKTLSVMLDATAGQDVTVFFGARGFQGQLTPVEVAPGRAELVMAVNAELLQAVIESTSVRVVIGDSVIQTAQDKAGKFKAFASTCAMLSMPKPQ